MLMTSRTHFGDLLRHFRYAAGMTQEQLAEHAALSVRAIAYLERGLHAPYPYTLRRLADALGLSAEDRAALASARFSAL